MIQLLKTILAFSLCLPLLAAAFPAGTQSVSIPSVSGVRSDLLKNIAPIVEKSIAAGNYPGAVIVAVHRGKVIYQGVFGSKRILPTTAPMTLDTIFDIASLTKVVAASPAILQLVEQGKINLDQPVSKYWPAFGENGKEFITVRQLLTHTSGLPPDVSPGKANVFNIIEKTRLLYTPGTKIVYSDVNFVVLQHLVEIISKQKFDIYVKTHILTPLGMKNTFFLPPSKIKGKIAPTEIIENQLRWGVVQDPLAHEMGGISGNAGLFSTAADLGRYAQCLLNNGRLPKKGSTPFLLGPLTILKMTSPQTPPELKEPRGLGWDIDSAYSSRGVLFPTRSFGHTGWTGTSLWIDPVTQTYLIILTSRTHPHPAPVNRLIEDRRIIANIVAASITDFNTRAEWNTGNGEISRAYFIKNINHVKVASSK